MKTYNKSLDYVSLAIAKYRQGDAVRAAKLFALAATASDAVKAVAVIEASNSQAFEVTAKAKAAAAKVEAAKKAEASKTKAATKRLKANDEDAEFEIDTDSIDDLIGDEDEEVPGEEEVVEEEVEADTTVVENDDPEFDRQFASVLAQMKRNSK